MRSVHEVMKSYPRPFTIIVIAEVVPPFLQRGVSQEDGGEVRNLGREWLRTIQNAWDML